VAEKRVFLSFLPLLSFEVPRDAEDMTALLLLLLATFLVLDALSLLDRTPDTHSESTQFGDYRF
jgi:hypothetical protein